MQGEVARLGMQLAGAHQACELLGAVALNTEAQRMQETAALSAHYNELYVQVLAMHQQGTWVCFSLVIPYRDAWVPHCLYHLLPSNPRPCPAHRHHRCVPCAQFGAACEALRLQGAALADVEAAYQWMSAERANVHAALHASLVEQARERAASDELRRQLADERAWRQACFGALVRFLTYRGLAGTYMYTYHSRSICSQLAEAHAMPAGGAGALRHLLGLIMVST